MRPGIEGALGGWEESSRKVPGRRCLHLVWEEEKDLAGREEGAEGAAFQLSLTCIKCSLWFK